MSHLSWRRPRGVIAILGTLAGVAMILGAQAPGLKPNDEDQITAQLTSRIVVALLENNHLAKPKIDAEVSKKWGRNFIKKLDPMKQNFLKADVEEFLKDDATLADKIKRGDIDFAKKVFARFLQRQGERYKQVQQILDEKPDFSIDEVLNDDPEFYDYPANEAEARDRLRKVIKLELLQKKFAQGEKDKEDPVERLKILYADQNRFYRQWDLEELLERYLSSLTETIDPHSEYMGPKQLEDFTNQALHLSLDGIGATLGMENGLPIIKDIVPNGAADKDGRLEIDDKILGVEIPNADSTGFDETSFAEKKLNDVVRQIRGPRGTKVRLIVQPANTKERIVYELTRQKIELVESHAKGKVLDVTAPDGKPLKVGVVDLPSFYGNMEDIRRGKPNAVSATADVKALLVDFKKQKADCVLLDLRNNGGGLLEEAISLSGLFIDKGPVVQVREPRGTSHRDDEDGGVAWDGPLVVLTNRLSASASEIFAGVIKDYDRGLLIGDVSTFGKGSVQSIMVLNEWLRDPDLPDLGGLRLTIQQFFRANGESTQIKGVEPHIHIPSTLDQMDKFSEGQMESALKFDKVPALPHDDYHRVTPELVAQLDKRSEARRKAHPKFQKLDLAIQKLIERKQKHEISLNEEKFKADSLLNEDDPAKEELTPKDKKKRAAERSVWDANFYNDEVMSIVGDYLTLGAKVVASEPTRATTNAANRR